MLTQVGERFRQLKPTGGAVDLVEGHIEFESGGELGGGVDDMAVECQLRRLIVLECGGNLVNIAVQADAE